MKAVNDNTLLGIGLYTVREASRLTNVSEQNIRRWIKGYKYLSSLETDKLLWQGELIKIDDTIVLSFLDMVETMIIAHFRKCGVSWRAIKEAATCLKDIYEDTHPFSMKRFKTDGKRIFTEIAKDGRINLFDLNKEHYVIKEVVERSMIDELEFNQEGQAIKWFPEIAKHKVVIDPNRSFGRPILSKEGISTEILANAFEAENSLDFVAKIYEVPKQSVKIAIDYEKSLKAA